MKSSKLLAYAQLLRLPNIFTLISDGSLALFAVNSLSSITVDGVSQFLILISSICFYFAGMVSNDVFDRKTDTETQSFRPIPSGRIQVKSAAILMICLFGFGLTLALAAFEHANRIDTAFAWSFGLFFLIILYNLILKHTFLGPLAMGGCRFVNMMMIMSLGSIPISVSIHLAGIVGSYIVGVTWLSRSEDKLSKRSQLIAASTVIVFAIILAQTLPLELSERTVPFYFLLILSFFVLTITKPILSSILQPDSKSVQHAVKNSILALIILDSALSTAIIGWKGILILLLMIPARRVGRWVYST